MQKAMYYEKIKNKKVKCLLCPKYCIIKNGEIGVCRVRKNIDGELFAISYGEIASFSLDPIEKKPIYNYKPGTMVFSVGSYGCNLKCKFCQNYEIAHGNPKTIKIEPEELITKAKSYKENIGIAYTYNEPLINYEYTFNCSRLAKKNNLDNILVTNGFLNEEPFRNLIKNIDAVNIDLKAFNNKFYKNICSGEIDDVKRNIKIATKLTHVEITLLLIDGLNSDKKELINMFKWIRNIDPNLTLHISRYFPRYKMKRPMTKMQTMIDTYKLAKKYLNNVYLGNV